MGLDKARIIYEEETKDAAQVSTEATNKTTKKRIDVMFNPSSLKIRSATKYSDPKPANVKETDPAKLMLDQFLRVENDILTVELFFDTTSEGINARGVRSVVQPILDLAKTPKGGDLPPKLVFAWGDFDFPCVISSIDQTYDYFDSAGRALRATLAITFLGYEAEEKEKKEEDKTTPPAGKDEKDKTQIKDGEKPPEVATRTTGDPTEWRQVYEAKGIDNPFAATATV